jgi:threonyl-tRNA synthetase
MIQITFPDGSKRDFESGVSAIEIAASISKSLAKEVLAVTINGQVSDVRTVLTEDATIKFHKFEDEEGKHAFWHTTSHVLAQAVKRLYPQTKLAIGPSIDAGFIMISYGCNVYAGNFNRNRKKRERNHQRKSPISRYIMSKEDVLKKVRDVG